MRQGTSSTQAVQLPSIDESRRNCKKKRRKKGKYFKARARGKERDWYSVFFGLLLKISQNNTRNAGRPRAEEKKEPAEEQTGFPRAPFTS